MTEIQAKGNNVLVKKLNFISDKTKKGIILPDQVQEKKQKISPIGEVISVGEFAGDFTIGSKVFYNPLACVAAFRYDDDMYMVMDKSGILLNVEKPEKINID